MPIVRTTETIRPSQSEFGQIAFDVMKYVYEIHNEFGRFFDEAVYKRELADRIPGIELELPVTVSYGTFSRLFKLDVLAHQRGVFEFKAAERIVSRHRGQTINYLLLFDLPHGKIINVRPERVDDEFVNCQLRLNELRNPFVDISNFDFAVPGASYLYDHVVGMIQDWGSGLEIGLYEEGVTHFLGGEEQVLLPVPVIGTKGQIHYQKMRLIAPDVAFKLTAFPDRLEAFKMHAGRLLQHTTLKAILWANITYQHVSFITIR